MDGWFWGGIGVSIFGASGDVGTKKPRLAWSRGLGINNPVKRDRFQIYAGVCRVTSSLPERTVCPPKTRERTWR